MANFITAQKRLCNFALLAAKMVHIRQLFIALCLVVSAPSFAEDDELDMGLIFTAKGAVFDEVVLGITGDLEEDLNFKTVTLSRKSTVKEIEKHIKSVKPKIVVLVENNAVGLYQKYQKANPKAEFPPSIALAALFVDRYVGKLKNATAIRYEIPAVTSIVNMRAILKNDVKKVGVVHREWMKPIIEQNAKYCRAEGIELVSISLPNKDGKLDKKLKSGLDNLRKKDVDAIWVLNDNALLNGKMLKNAWFPVMKKSKLPVIVGVDLFLKSDWNFGSFAIVPDHYSLGVQAASIIGEIMEEDWEIGDRDVEQPVSVKKIVNTTVLENKKIQFKQDKLSAMDEVVR